LSAGIVIERTGLDKCSSVVRGYLVKLEKKIVVDTKYNPTGGLATGTAVRISPTAISTPATIGHMEDEFNEWLQDRK
jgi:hypothetical protein